MQHNAKRERHARITDAKCPKCHHKAAWTNRSDMNPAYMLKCSRCGNKDYGK